MYMNIPMLHSLLMFTGRLYYLQTKDYPGYNFVSLILGPLGNTQKWMEAVRFFYTWSCYMFIFCS